MRKSRRGRWVRRCHSCDSTLSGVEFPMMRAGTLYFALVVFVLSFVFFVVNENEGLWYSAGWVSTFLVVVVLASAGVAFIATFSKELDPATKLRIGWGPELVPIQKKQTTQNGRTADAAETPRIGAPGKKS